MLTTLPANADATAFARVLVDEHLAACVNLLPPMTSIYRWDGGIEQADERQVVIKTTSARLRELEVRIQSLHPYDIPEFVVIPITDGSHAYLKWLSENTSS